MNQKICETDIDKKEEEKIDGNLNMKMREYLTIQHLLHLNDLDWRYVPENIQNE